MLRVHKNIVVITIFVVFCTIFMTTNARAQFSQSDFSFSTNPVSPGPNERVTITIESLSLNLNNYFITWYLNGQKEQGNYGLTSFSFFTGEIGEESRVSTVLQLNSAQVLRRALVVSPVEIDLIWEANTYTPPFYKGKALPNRESTIKVVTIPQTGQITPNEAFDLVYYWKRDGRAVPLSSGYGKQAYSFTNNVLKQEEAIEVSISDRSGSGTGSKSIKIDSFFDPETQIYLRNDDRRLLLNKTIKQNDEIISFPFTLSAQPYSFSKEIENISFKWNINGQEITPENEEAKTDITLYPETGVNSANINVITENLKKLYENDTLNLLINV